MNIIPSKIIAVIALLANAVSVDGACLIMCVDGECYPDVKGATVGENVLKEDADGIVTIPADWTVIPVRAFHYCHSLKKVVIPANITEIQTSAFEQSGLEELSFAANSQLVFIGDSAFERTKDLRSIEIPKSVTEIYGWAFCDSALEQVSFAANSELKKIGNGTFSETHIRSIVIPKSVVLFGSDVFKETPCSDKSIFQPGTAVENCQLVTSSPTTFPSTASSVKPSLLPSYLPTTPPSSEPSLVPSVEPTTDPSNVPSFSPSPPTTFSPSTTLIVSVLVLCVLVALVVFYLVKRCVTRLPIQTYNHVLDEESSLVAADNIPYAATSQTTYLGQPDSSSPPPAEAEEIPQNKSRHKGATWRREADAKKRERSEEDMMINGPGGIEQGKASERKPAASHLKKAGIGKGFRSTQNQEVSNRTLRATKKLDYPQDRGRRPHRENEETGIGPSDIARAGEALLQDPNIQKAIASALVENQIDSVRGNHIDQSMDRVPAVSPLQKLQVKLLDQAHTRIATTPSALAPSETAGRHLDEDWGVDVVASRLGAGIDVGTDQDNSRECCVCLDAHATHLFAPCYHLCICRECQIPYADGTVKECPMCRVEFTSVQKVF